MTQDPHAPFTRATPPVPLDDDDLDLTDEERAAQRPAGEVTPLELIAAELEADVDLGTIDLEVPGRPGYGVRCRCDVAYDELVDWRDRASGVNAARNRAERRKPTAQAQAGRLNELSMAAFVLVHTADAILRHGAEVPDSDSPTGLLTFTSPTFLRMMKASTARAAVVKFFGVDGHVTAAANRVLVESGWTDAVLAGDIEPPADPTNA